MMIRDAAVASTLSLGGDTKRRSTRGSIPSISRLIEAGHALKRLDIAAASSASNETDFSDAKRSAVESVYEDSEFVECLEIFDIAKEAVFQLMEGDSYIRFLNKERIRDVLAQASRLAYV